MLRAASGSRVRRSRPGVRLRQKTMYVALFDIDSTLLRTQGAGRAAFAETFRAEFDIERFEGTISFAGRSDRAIVREVLAQHGIEDEPGTWQRFLQGYLQRLRRTLGARRGGLLPGVLPLLRAIRERSDIAMGIVTGNVAAGARLKLEHYGIDSYFDFGGYGDHHTDRGGIAADALDAADAFLRTAHPAVRGARADDGDRRYAGGRALRPCHRGEGDRGGDRGFIPRGADGGGSRPDVRRPDGSRRRPRDHHRSLNPRDDARAVRRPRRHSALVFGKRGSAAS